MRTPTLIGGAALTTISYSCLLYPFSLVAFFHVSGCPQLRRSAWLAEADAVSNEGNTRSLFIRASGLDAAQLADFL